MEVIQRYSYKTELEVRRSVLIPIFTKLSPHILHAMFSNDFGRAILGDNHSTNPQSSMFAVS